MIFNKSRLLVLLAEKCQSDKTALALVAALALAVEQV